MIEADRIRFCAKVFKAFGVDFRILADLRLFIKLGIRGSEIPSRTWKRKRNKCCSIGKN